MRSQNLTPRNLSQYDLCGMDTAHMAIALGNHHWSQVDQANAVMNFIYTSVINHVITKVMGQQ
jgi:hypothetical protein